MATETKPLTDDELRAVTALVNFEASQWRYGCERYGEAQFDPQTPLTKALYAELARRGIGSEVIR